jgi:hypothetical protein
MEIVIQAQYVPDIFMVYYRQEKLPSTSMGLFKANRNS